MYPHRGAGEAGRAGREGGEGFPGEIVRLPLGGILSGDDAAGGR